MEPSFARLKRAAAVAYFAIYDFIRIGDPERGGNMDETLRYVWGEYRTWDATSRLLKQRISRISLLVLGLTLVGTALGTLSPLVRGMWDAPWIATVMPWLAAVALGIATYVTNHLLRESERQGWVKARAIAEALKSEAYLYTTSAPPYNTAAAAQLIAQKAGEVVRILPDVLAESISDQERARKIPEKRWSGQEYAEGRIRDQIEFYRSAITRHGNRLTAARSLALGLGVLAVMLSVASANGGASSTIGVWAAASLGVVTTAASATAAWFQSGRHQQIALNYQSLVAKLELLLAQYRTNAISDTQLIIEAEALFQAEHAQWLTELQTPVTSAGETTPATG
jgi:conflict system pore-forming effector with SLATT domain/uncharacterized protein DUF4231